MIADHVRDITRSACGADFRCRQKCWRGLAFIAALALAALIIAGVR